MNFSLVVVPPGQSSTSTRQLPNILLSECVEANLFAVQRIYGQISGTTDVMVIAHIANGSPSSVMGADFDRLYMAQQTYVDSLGTRSFATPWFLGRMPQAAADSMWGSASQLQLQVTLTPPSPYLPVVCVYDQRVLDSTVTMRGAQFDPTLAWVAF